MALPYQEFVFLLKKFYHAIQLCVKLTRYWTTTCKINGALGCLGGVFQRMAFSITIKYLF